MVRIRLSEQERRQEILEAARKCFLEKGFSDTTMEAVIERTSLSKGGVYRYYSSTSQMLADLMKKGTVHRFELLREACNTHITELSQKLELEQVIDCLVDCIYQKIIDENPYKKLYALFLLELPRNKELAKLKEELTVHFFTLLSQEIYAKVLPAQIFSNEVLINFINAMIVAVEIMNMRESFKAQPDFLKTMLRTYFEKSMNN